MLIFYENQEDVATRKYYVDFTKVFHSNPKGIHFRKYFLLLKACYATLSYVKRWLLSEVMDGLVKCNYPFLW